ncbi:capsid triplex subunit 2 [Bovine alphaherpesvirus 5]|uniref:UL18 capsid protein n=1 Tax=Bovine alphaherpesvirus 5 TaxID=35244 RepID=Q6X229_9ALPH|nr:UL18 capsid protein [Bovine alphaherpesvirus 5]AAR86144.1 UL18 capsid protein [Bovine alphaherpesvirus 5]AQM74705.1 capsid triplex subunit 2 [Bovine alphaherpesvirus 5]ART33266.1 capsid triplex subunit 2 [Bovine alphaherpesvirus 5]QVY10574.1 UL18 capsid protein [Bovine alphaherpesvirus 5]UHJ15466.1 UL18 capsid protein [Bovine alphaherpesvirus 5]
MAQPETFEVEIVLPGDLSHSDLAALQKCEGKVVFLATLRRRVQLADVALASFSVNGVAPDTLALMAAYRCRFPAVVLRVAPGRMLAAPLGVGPMPRGAFLQNTGPFDLCNGDAVCLLPPLLGPGDRLALASAGAELLFPTTVPLPQARELVARVVARAVEALGDRGAAARPRGADVMYHNGRRYQVTPDVQHREGADAAARTLALHMVFNVNEGSLLLLSLIPNLLTQGLQDGVANAIVQLGSASREAGQLLRLEPAEPREDGRRRFCLYGALAAWISSATRLGDAVGARPVAKVCTFDGPSVVRTGEKAPIVVPL